VINAIQERETTIQTARADAIKTLASAAGSIDQAERINVAIRDMEDMRFEVEDAQKKGGDTAAIEARIAARNLEIREMMQQARGEIARVLDEAMAYRWERSITERATAERFQSELLAYQQAPAYYRLRLYMETLATGMANRRKTIVAADNTQTPVFRFDFKDPESALDALLTEDR